MPSGKWGWEEYWEKRFLEMGHGERAFAVIEHAAEMDDRAYWRAVRVAWSDSDRTRFALWREVFTAPRPRRADLMDDDERAELARLPERIEVYRGVTDWNRRAGISWTLDREMAAWFARRFAFSSAGVVVAGTVLKERVVALIDDRAEREVIVWPRYVYARRSERP